jgi:hypothetical protein
MRNLKVFNGALEAVNQSPIAAWIIVPFSPEIGTPEANKKNSRKEVDFGGLCSYNPVIFSEIDCGWRYVWM